MSRPLLAVVLSLLLVLPAAGLNIACSGGDDSESTPTEPKVETSAIGPPVTVQNLQYKVTSAESATSVGNGPSKSEATSGVFVVVSLDVTNQSDANMSFSNSSVVLKSGALVRSPDFSGSMAMKDGFSLVESIPVGKTVSGSLVYKVPDEAVSDAALVIGENLRGVKAAEIPLGL